MIEDLEKEVIQYRAIAAKCGAEKLDKLETENTKLSGQLKESQDKLKTANSEISKFRNFFGILEVLWIIFLFFFSLSRNSEGKGNNFRQKWGSGS